VCCLHSVVCCLLGLLCSDCMYIVCSGECAHMSFLCEVFHRNMKSMGRWDCSLLCIGLRVEQPHIKSFHVSKSFASFVLHTKSLLRIGSPRVNTVLHTFCCRTVSFRKSWKGQSVLLFHHSLNCLLSHNFVQTGDFTCHGIFCYVTTCRIAQREGKSRALDKWYRKSKSLCIMLQSSILRDTLSYTAWCGHGFNKLHHTRNPDQKSDWNKEKIE